MTYWLELEPPERKVSGSSPTAVVLFTEKRVSVYVEFNTNITPLGGFLPN